MNIDWNSSFLWGILGLIGGGITSFIFFTLSNKTKRIIYEINSNPLISDKLSSIKGLRITFFDDSIPNLVSTTVFITNNGSDIIESTDFAKVSPLILKTNGKFLVYDDVKSFITKISNETSNITLTQIDANTIKVDFDYLKKNDKILLTILHTGQIKLFGTLKRGRIIASSIYDRKNQLSNLFFDILVVFLCFLAVLVRGIEGSINTIFNVIINVLIGYSLIDYAQKKYREIDMPKNISVEGNNLENLSIISGNDNVVHSANSDYTTHESE